MPCSPRTRIVRRAVRIQPNVTAKKSGGRHGVAGLYRQSLTASERWDTDCCRAAGTGLSPESAESAASLPTAANWRQGFDGPP